MQDNKLFFVAAKTADGDSLDLHVVAVDKSAATTLWRGCYELADTVKPEFVGIIPGVTPDGASRVISWDVINPS